MKLPKILSRIRSAIPVDVASWAKLRKSAEINLYAGDLPDLKGYEKFTGLSVTKRNRRHIRHDVSQPYPLPDNSVEMFQSEDVFEHIEFERMPAIIAEIHRILKPGGLFRLGLPDYRCDVLERRSVKDASGQIIFDPQGGGRYIEGKVVNRGHVWFPKYETVRELLAGSPFRIVDFRHYYDEEGRAVTHPIDYSKGHVKRTPDHDPRVQNPYRPISIVVDCYK